MKNGMAVIDLIPKEILIKLDRNEGTIYIRTFDGGTSTITLSHANADGLVGASIKGIVISEYAIAPSDVMQYMTQSLKENNGWAFIVSTPRGRNQFYKLFKANENNPYGASIKRSINETIDEKGNPLFTWKDILQDIEYGLIPDIETAEQEYKCSWDSASGNSFYKVGLKKLFNEGRLNTAKYQPHLPVEVSWDLGTKDRAVLTFIQYDIFQDKIFIIGYYSNNYQDIEHYLVKLHSICFEKGWRVPTTLYMPHDANKRRIETMTSVSDLCQARGYEVVLVPKIDIKINAINKVRRVLFKVHFNADSSFIFEQLKAYEKRLDKTTLEYTDVPVHNEASDYADSFETGMRGLEIKYSGFLNVSTYKK